MIKKLLANKLVLIIAVAVLATFAFQAFNGKNKDLPIVAITQIVEHPALDQEREAIIQTLNDAGYIDGKTVKIEFQSAQGNIATAAQIGQRFAGLNPSVIVAISTPSAQAMLAAIQGKNIPMVFTAVSDPAGAKLSDASNQPLAGVTGVSDYVSAQAHLDLVAKMLPAKSRIGVLYNSAEINSVTLVNELSALSAERGFTVVPATVTKTSDIGGVIDSLIGKVDVIYVPTDNTVVSAIDMVVQVASQNNIPVFSADPLLIGRGITAAVGFDRNMLGEEAGKKVIQILKGAEPANIAISTNHQPSFRVDNRVAVNFGLEIPEELPTA